MSVRTCKCSELGRNGKDNHTKSSGVGFYIEIPNASGATGVTCVAYPCNNHKRNYSHWTVLKVAERTRRK